MSMLRLAALLAILASAVACGDDTPTTPTPTPTRPIVNEPTYEGTLTVNGAATHSFSTASGVITVTLTSLDPDSAAVVGVSLGTWNSTGTCQIVLANDSATQGVIVTGNATTPGTFCARIYDVGRLGAATSYKLDVAHY
jgi:hypothetical protein